MGTKLFGVVLAIAITGLLIVGFAEREERLWAEEYRGMKPKDWEAVQHSMMRDLHANIGGRIGCSTGAMKHWQRTKDKWWFAGHLAFYNYRAFIEDIRPAGKNPRNSSWSVEILEDEGDWISTVGPAPDWWNVAKEQKPATVLIKQEGQIKYVIQGGRDNVIYLFGVSAAPQ